ncbi:hypothetical protein [Streptosporangium sp. NPDC050280]|uniref:hypothetical protein n=1 Tax=unclassified Streptosporangium TaxID=2632669 RepID=UPI00342CE88F
MGLVGSSLDDAAESLFSSLEFELFRILGPFVTREQARRAVAVWVDDFDTMRLHSANGMCCPVEYEHQRAAMRPKREVPTVQGIVTSRRCGHGQLLAVNAGSSHITWQTTKKRQATNTTQQNHGVLLSWRGHRKCLTRPAQGVWSDQEGFLPVRR